MTMTAEKITAEKVVHLPQGTFVYPESDGEPISDHTLQFEWIVIVKDNLEALFASQPDVFVAGDLLWYPLLNQDKIRAAPDALVVFGRPKGQRGSYQQANEGNIAPQVVFEIWSPGNRSHEKPDKLAFYQRYGVEEYYAYDPFRLEFEAWRRSEDGSKLIRIEAVNGFVSPRLGVRFDFIPGTALQLFLPNGEPFQTFTELKESAVREHEARLQAEQKQREAEAQAERFAARLRELGVDPDTL